MQDVTTTDRVARNQSDHHLRHRADQFLQIQDIQAWHTIFTNVAAGLVASNLLVATGTKCELPVGLRVKPGQQDNSDGSILSRISEGLNQLSHRIRRKSIATVRTIDRHLGNALTLLINNLFEFADFFPVHNHTS